MDRIQAMHVFTRVVEANGFSKAARTLNLSPASVTLIIRNLEEALGVRLLQRTTRRLSLTVDGATYYELCRRILSDLEDTEACFRSAVHEPKGRLRVEMPGSIGRLIVLPALHSFHERFPDVELTIALAEKHTDLVQEGMDCAIRLGALQSSRLVARKIATLRPVICAAPDYLARHGEPRTIEDLSRHRRVDFTCSHTGRPKEWAFIVDGQLASLKLDSRLAVNESDGHLMCGVQGLGLIRSLDRLAQPYLRSGRLREVLTHMSAPPEPLWIVHAGDRPVSPTLRVFINWIMELFECPALPQLHQNAN
jgi:LysR family transcriptional regulator for bpeEF and oprC